MRKVIPPEPRSIQNLSVLKFTLSIIKQNYDISLTLANLRGIFLSYVKHIRLKEVNLFPFLNDFVIFLEGVCLLPFGLFLSDGMGVLVV